MVPRGRRNLTLTYRICFGRESACHETHQHSNAAETRGLAYPPIYICCRGRRHPKPHTQLLEPIPGHVSCMPVVARVAGPLPIRFDLHFGVEHHVYADSKEEVDLMGGSVVRLLRARTRPGRVLGHSDISMRPERHRSSDLTRMAEQKETERIALSNLSRRRDLSRIRFEFHGVHGIAFFCEWGGEH